MSNNPETEFYNKLHESKSELKFSFREISEYVCKRTNADSKGYYGKFRRKADEGKGFTEQEKAAINAFIEEKRSNIGFEKMDDMAFSELVCDLAVEFELKQQPLAKLLGVSQPTVNRIMKMTDPLKRDAGQQRDILSAFQKLCYRESEDKYPTPADVFEEHYDTAKLLYLKLNGNTRIFDIFEENEKKYLYSDHNILLLLTDYMLTLPYEQQKLIMAAPVAFLDTLLSEIWIDDYVYCDHRIDILNWYREQSTDKKEIFQKELERLVYEARVMTYSDGFLFEMISQKRAMIQNARERKIPDADGCIIYPEYTWYKTPVFRSCNTDGAQSKEPEESERRKAFEQLLLGFIQFDLHEYPKDWFDDLFDKVIESVEYRLNMSPFEWYLDMLISAYSYISPDVSEVRRNMDLIEEERYDLLYKPYFEW